VLEHVGEDRAVVPPVRGGHLGAVEGLDPARVGHGAAGELGRRRGELEAVEGLRRQPAQRRQQRAVAAADLDDRPRAQLGAAAERADVGGRRPGAQLAPAAEAQGLGRVGLGVARLVELALVDQETAEKPSATFAQLTVFHQASR
jgi:hypothetical protein